MIPVLYAPTVAVEYELNALGTMYRPVSWTKTLLGYLPDAITCTHTEERNGAWELEMTYPDTGQNANLIAVNCILQVQGADPTEDESDFPMFRIVKRTPVLGEIHVTARHITEMLSSVAIWSFSRRKYSVQGPAAYFDFLLWRSVGPYPDGWKTAPFLFSSDIETEGVQYINYTAPSSFKSYLGGGDLPEGAQSMLQIYGGEFKYTGWEIQLLQSRGENRGLELRYGLNISGINIEEDMDGIVTGILPYYIGEEETTQGARIAYSSYRRLFPYDRIKAMDFSSSFSSTPTMEELSVAAEAYLERNDIGNPVRMIDVDIILLEQTKEWKQYNMMANLQLCDTVRLVYDRNGINLTADMKVVELTYDVLRERTTNVKIGTIQRTMVKELAQNTLYRQYRTN